MSSQDADETMKEEEEEDDEKMIPEERMAWLRERGVKVETPEERKAVTNVRKEHYSNNEAISYVLIPCDTSKPLEELTFFAPEPSFAGDALEQHLKEAFDSSSNNNNGENAPTVDLSLLDQQHQATATLGSGGTPAVSEEAMQQVASEGNVETFRLVHPTPSNHFVGVYMYLDEVGMLKRLPLNTRASEYCQRAGFEPPPQFYGDVYLSRVQTRPRLRHLPFVLGSDTAMDADWLRGATMENVEWQMQQNRLAGRPHAEVMQPGVAGADGVSKKEEGFSWTQTEDELEVKVRLPKSTTSRGVGVKYRPQSLQVTCRDEVLVLLDLFERIDPEACTWTLERDGEHSTLIITLDKVEQALWPRIKD